MGRYIKDVQLEQPIDVVSMVMDDFIYHNHFSRTDWNGEMVFYLKDRHKKERYMKWVYVDGRFHVEAWLKNSFGGETDLDGVGGGASRREFRASIDGLIETLKKTAAGSLAGGHIGSDPLHHDSGHVDNHDVWKADTSWQQNAGQPTGQYSQQSAGQQAGQNRQQGSGQWSGQNRQQGSGQPTGQYSRQSAGQQTGSYRQQSAGQYRQPTGNAGRPAQGPEANVSLIFAILALMFCWAMPIIGIVFIVLARRKLEYSSNPGLVKVLCILAVVGMVLCLAFQFMAIFLSDILF